MLYNQFRLASKLYTMSNWVLWTSKTAVKCTRRCHKCVLNHHQRVQKMLIFDLTLMHCKYRSILPAKGPHRFCEVYEYMQYKNKDDRVVSGSVGDGQIRCEKCRDLSKVARVFMFSLRRAGTGQGWPDLDWLPEVVKGDRVQCWKSQGASRLVREGLLDLKRMKDLSSLARRGHI